NAAEVRLDQNAQGVPPQVRRQPATGGSDPTPETEGHRPPTSTDASPPHWARARLANGSPHLCFRGRPSPDITEPSRIGFGDQRVDRTHVLVAGQRKQVSGGRVPRFPHAQGAGENNGRLELAQLVDLQSTSELAKCVSHYDRGRDLVAKEVARVREDGSDARVDRPVLADRHLTYANARYVGDRVERPRRQDAELHAPVAKA